MANFTAGTSFTDGVTNDVTAAKLNALIADAVPTSNLSLNSTTGTISNFTASTANVTLGTIPTLTAGTTTSTAATITSATITTGTIPTLVATTLVTTGTGTAAAPAIVPTGDTNTGLFFPAADTIAATTQGTERLRIDSSGRVGIGTTTPTSTYRISVKGDASSIIGATEYDAGNGDKVAVGFVTATSPSFSISNKTSNGVIRFDTNDTERLRIDSSGRVGIGTTSIGASLDIAKSDNTGSVSDFPSLRVTNTNSTQGNGTSTYNYARMDVKSGNGTVFADFGTRYDSVYSGAYIGTETSHPVALQTAGVERLRITSGGEVYIAGTTDQGAYNLQVNGTGVWGAGAYVNGSDSRIKEDIQPIASGLDVVEKLNPVTYKYKETWSSDQSIQSGFIAQELLTALDGQIYANGVVQQGGAEGYYSVAYQNLIAVLTKAIQELKAKNDILEFKVAALEAA